jgi:hypothetical protein
MACETHRQIPVICDASRRVFKHGTKILFNQIDIFIGKHIPFVYHKSLHVSAQTSESSLCHTTINVDEGNLLHHIVIITMTMALI